MIKFRVKLAHYSHTVQFRKAISAGFGYSDGYGDGSGYGYSDGYGNGSGHRL